MAAVGAVLGLMGLTLWWLRRSGWSGAPQRRRPGSRKLEAVDRLPLGPQHTLHLVRVGGRGVLLACSPSSCLLVESLPWKEIEEGGAGLPPAREPFS